MFQVSSFKFQVSSFRIQVSGFTLLETVIALGVILGGIIGPYTLATRGVITSGTIKEKLVALNLAQEGIELVRHLRENNVLAGNKWDKNIGKGCNGGPWQIGVVDLESGTQVMGEMECYEDQQLYYYPDVGLYTHSNELGNFLGDPVQSIYKRKIEITQPIPEGPPPHPDYTPGVVPPDQMLIKVTVAWQQRSINQKVTLDEVIFDWE